MVVKSIKKPGKATVLKTANAEKDMIGKEALLKEINKKAYELFLNRKGHHGNDLNDWLEAEKIVKKKYSL